MKIKQPTIPAMLRALAPGQSAIVACKRETDISCATCRITDRKFIQKKMVLAACDGKDCAPCWIVTRTS